MPQNPPFAFLSAGFRPLFLLAALWAALSMLLWISEITGLSSLPVSMDGVDWHVHGLVFGYGSAVLSGFLLTAIPNWTGRAPLAGGALGLVVLLWLVARGLSLVAAPLWALAAAELGFLSVIWAFCLREILLAGNKRNLVVLVMIAAFAAGDALFLWDVAHDEAGFAGMGLRLGLGALILLIILIGGRIIPAFTRNWLKQHAPETTPPAEFGLIDKVAMLVSGLSILGWVAVAEAAWLGWIMGLAGVLLIARLARWRGAQVRAEALMIALHIAYLFVAIGFLLWAGAMLLPDHVPMTAATHAWTSGAVGLMTITVMCRATLGHSGNALVAGLAEKALLAMVALAALSRVLSGFDFAPGWVLHLAATLWIGGFTLFALRFAPVMFRPKR